MKDVFNKINEKLRSQGRCGIDAFSRTLLIIAVVMLLLGCIPDTWYFALYGIFPLIWAVFRSLSKNRDKRESELDAYGDMVERRQENTALRKRKWADRKTHRYYRCKYCDTVFRVPRGKGRIRITCPGCGEPYIKKT